MTKVAPLVSGTWGGGSGVASKSRLRRYSPRLGALDRAMTSSLVSGRRFLAGGAGGGVVAAPEAGSGAVGASAGAARARPRPRWITPGIGGAFDRSTPRAFMAGPMSWGSAMTGRNRSPTLRILVNTLSMRKVSGRILRLATSSHVTGVETLARGSGRMEYTA